MYNHQLVFIYKGYFIFSFWIRKVQKEKNRDNNEIQFVQNYDFWKISRWVFQICVIFFWVFILVLLALILIGPPGFTLTMDHSGRTDLNFLNKMHAHFINAQIAKAGIMKNFRTIIWDLLVNMSDNAASENIISMPKQTPMQYSGMRFHSGCHKIQVYPFIWTMFQHDLQR